MSYFLTYRKCAFCRVMLFEQDGLPVEEALDTETRATFCDELYQAAYREQWPLEQVAARITKWRQAARRGARCDLDPVTLELITTGLVFNGSGNVMWPRVRGAPSANASSTLGTEEDGRRRQRAYRPP